MIREHGRKVALVQQGEEYTYIDIENKINEWLTTIRSKGVKPGMVVALQSDFSFSSICLLFSLFENKNIAAVISPSLDSPKDLLSECQASFMFSSNGNDWETLKTGFLISHPLVEKLKRKNRPGFVVFTSGTTSKPKAVLHDLTKFQRSLRDVNKSYRTLAFLLLDHIAGIDTLFYTFKSGGSLVLTRDRTPNAICGLIEQHKVEVLPVSPSFINLLYVSKAYQNFDLSSIKVVSLGSEPITSGILNRAFQIFPDSHIIQKYGTSEFGSPRTKTKLDDPTWIRMKSEFFRTKVVDEILWVKSETTMLGYLNQDNQSVKNGWYCTGDVVEVDGDWIKIVGRDSDLISVGGEKVHPSEIESVILELDWVKECMVYGEPNPLLGNIICVDINNVGNKPDSEARKAVRRHCLLHLERYKVPVKINLTSVRLVSDRQKKSRK